MRQFFWVITLAASFSVAVRAEEAGITVTGTAEVGARPDLVEITLNVSGTGELTEDAIVTYQSALQSTLRAFEELNLEGLEVTQQELAIRPRGAPQANVGVVVAVPGIGGEQGPAAPVQVSRSLRLVLRGLRNIDDREVVRIIGKLLDTAKDAGVQVSDSAESAVMARLIGIGAGTGTGLTFVVEDAESLRRRAYEAAFAQARQRAERLAGLAGVKLGRVVSIEEHEAAPSSEQGVQAAVISAVYGSVAKGTADNRLTSDKLGSIPLRVSLRVRFAIE